MVICPRCMMELPSKEALSNHVCGSDSVKNVEDYNASNKELLATVKSLTKKVAKLEEENKALKAGNSVSKVKAPSGEDK